MKFGIIGCGTISNYYGEAIGRINDARLAYAYDADQGRCRDFSNKYHAVSVGSVEELLQSDADIICICTPSGLHAEYAEAAAKAKKHIVCEKPIGITKTQLDAIIEACKKNAVKFCAISQLVYSDAAGRIKTALNEGRLGKIILADLSMKYYRSPEYYRTGGWRGTWAMDGGGALMNQGIHGISMLLYLLGPVRSVCALTRTRLHEIEVEDTAAAILEFKNGAIGTLIGTTSVKPGYPRVLSIHGSNGTVTLTEDTISCWNIEGEEAFEMKNGIDCGTASNPTAFTSALHQRQLEDFIEALKANRTIIMDEHAGRQSVDLILSIYESSRTGKPVVL
jgi:predicted dehydrogenase